jgi:hypothetical protein
MLVALPAAPASDILPPLERRQARAVIHIDFDIG